MVGAVDISVLGAFAGGVVSFASPCVLPLVPVYLSVVTGAGTTGDGGSSRRRATAVLGFIAGFTAVFVALGLTATSVGHVLATNRVAISRVAGLVVLAMALFLAGSLFLRSPWLYQEKRWHPSLDRFGPFAAPVAGVAFGFGWTPCIGPVLTSVLAVSATSSSIAGSALLLLSYALGLGIPFLVAGLALHRFAGALSFFKRHSTAVVGLSAGVLGVFGVLLALNLLTSVTVAAQRLATAAGLGFLVTAG